MKMNLTEKIAIIHSQEFFNDIDFRLRFRAANKENIKYISTAKEGSEIWLKVQVIDSFMSQYLYKWLEGKDDSDSHLIPFGCSLLIIDGGEMIRKTDFIDKTNQCLDVLRNKNESLSPDDFATIKELIYNLEILKRVIQ